MLVIEMTLPVFHFLFCFSPLFLGQIYIRVMHIVFVNLIVNRCIYTFSFGLKNCIKWKSTMCNQALSISFLTT